MFSSLSVLLRRFIARLRGIAPGADHPSVVLARQVATSSETHVDATSGPTSEASDRDRLLAKRAAEAAGRGRNLN